MGPNQDSWCPDGCCAGDQAHLGSPPTRLERAEWEVRILGRALCIQATVSSDVASSRRDPILSRIEWALDAAVREDDQVVPDVEARLATLAKEVRYGK